MKNNVKLWCIPGKLLLMFWHGILFVKLTDDRGKFVKSKWWCHASFSCVLHLWSSFYYCVYAYMAMGSINFLNSVVVSKVSFFVADNSNKTRHLFHYLEDLFCSNCRYISGNAFFFVYIVCFSWPTFMMIKSKEIYKLRYFSTLEVL